MEILNNYTYDNCHTLSSLFFENKTMFGRIVDIYDGDTCTIVLLCGISNIPIKFNCRIMHIDTAEMKSKNLLLKSKAIQARNRLFNLITNKFNDNNFELEHNDIKKILNNECFIVNIETYGLDLYGRLLMDIIINDNKVSSILIEEKLAYNYEGKTKLTEQQQLEFFNLI